MLCKLLFFELFSGFLIIALINLTVELLARKKLVSLFGLSLEY